MADNIISQYYTKNDGSQIGNDAQLINGVYQNEKIVNKNNGEKFVKSQTYRNVFDKVDEKISKIDDANANGVCSCKNASGVEVDTFKCHVPVSNSAPTLKWGESNTIGTVDGKPLTVILPPNPNTTYSAGEGLVLEDSTFKISPDLLVKINNASNSYKPRIKCNFIDDFSPNEGSSELPVVGQIYTTDQLFTYDSNRVIMRKEELNGKYKCIKAATVPVTWSFDSGHGKKLIANPGKDISSIFEWVEWIV